MSGIATFAKVIGKALLEGIAIAIIQSRLTKRKESAPAIEPKEDDILKAFGCDEE